jgi:aldose 1-epimerase
MIPKKENFQKTVDNKPVDLYILKNQNNAQVAITNYGGRIVSLLVPDSKGVLTDVVTGHDSLESYWKEDEPYFGAIVGRYGNRIAKGRFTLNNKTYELAVNNGPNALHGGIRGFSARVWNAIQVSEQVLEIRYDAKDGEEGYPGNMHVKVTYTLTDHNELRIDYEASTDAPTVVNLTNHAYFNLDGESSETVLDQELTINADRFIPVDATSIPLGHFEDVAGTPFDFRKSKEIGFHIEDQHEQIINGQGYDHTFVLNHPGNTLGLCAIARGQKTGITMEVLTTEPGVQFYSANFLNGKDSDGKGGRRYPRRSAFCLETQHFPDSPNHETFPTTVLNPGERFRSTTIYRFT